MAVAKPVRFLLLSVLGLLLYIIFSFSSNPAVDAPPKIVPNPDDPGREFRVDRNFVDPNLEGPHAITSLYTVTDMLSQQLPENRLVL